MGRKKLEKDVLRAQRDVYDWQREAWSLRCRTEEARLNAAKASARIAHEHERALARQTLAAERLVDSLNDHAIVVSPEMRKAAVEALDDLGTFSVDLREAMVEAVAGAFSSASLGEAGGPS